MKMVKRILSLVLVLAMVACLGVTAFADEAGTATIKIVAGGETTTIEGTAGKTLYTVLEEAEENGDLNTVEWTQVKDWEKPDVIHQALTQIDGNASKTGTAADLAGTKFSSVTEDAAVSGHPGYYLVDQNGDTYHYVYVGYDWTYTSSTVNYGDLYTYMCCYTLTAGETVVITYSLQITDWTQTGAL